MKRLAKTDKKACYLKCNWIDALYHKNDEITQTLNSCQAMLTCIDRVLYLNQRVYSILIRNNEKIIISVQESFDLNGKISDASLSAYSTTYPSTQNPIVTLDCIFCYDKKYQYLDHIFIQDIICKDFNKGYGSMIMGSFLQYAVKFRVSRISGVLSRVDLERPNDHKNLLYHFYKKFGFEISEDNHISLAFPH